MPELPDVEMQKRYLDMTSLHQRIESVEVRDDYILGRLSQDRLRAGLEGHALETRRRHGKYLFAGLGSGKWLMLHFGMDGGLAYFEKATDEPPYSRILIRFENGRYLSYVSQRKLGRMGIVDDIDRFIREERLGPDALDLDFPAFEKALGATRAMAKAAFMDQHIIAGIGNIYADEILSQAGIGPRRRPSDLSEAELRRLFDVMKAILRAAIDLDADSRRFPDSWLFHHRYPGAHCPRCGGEIARTKISTRTTYYCPHCQK